MGGWALEAQAQLGCCLDLSSWCREPANFDAGAILIAFLACLLANLPFPKSLTSLLSLSFFQMHPLSLSLSPGSDELKVLTSQVKHGGGNPYDDEDLCES